MNDATTPGPEPASTPEPTPEPAPGTQPQKAPENTSGMPPEKVPALTDPESRRREQRGWYFYDWANSAYVTTVLTVLFQPYLISVARTAACGASNRTCGTDLSVLGVPVSPGSLPLYVVTAATILSALCLPLVGAWTDRSRRKKDLLAGFAWAGAASGAAMVFVTGANWQLGVALLFAGNVCLSCSTVVYDGILCEIATPEERDRVSSRGWALGYLGGGLLLAANLAVVQGHDLLGLSTQDAVRLCLLSAGLWWGGFTIIPWLRVRNRPPVHVVHAPGNPVRQSAGQLFTTLRQARAFPMTLLFLLAYLFFNDGVQTVISAASIFGQHQLGFEQSTLLATVLLVQFVAFGGALLFGRVARRFGSKHTIIGSLLVWIAIVSVAFFLPAGQIVPFLALAVAIGIVLGGTQALSRSLYSQFVPRGREAEYFSLYQACERGTSWLGTLVFGLVYQLTDSYRPAIFSLVIFFVVGLVLLVFVDARRAVHDAGNQAPQTL